MWFPAGQRTLQHSGDILDTQVVVNPAHDFVCSEVRTDVNIERNKTSCSLTNWKHFLVPQSTVTFIICGTDSDSSGDHVFESVNPPQQQLCCVGLTWNHLLNWFDQIAAVHPSSVLTNNVFPVCVLRSGGWSVIRPDTNCWFWPVSVSKSPETSCYRKAASLSTTSSTYLLMKR